MADIFISYASEDRSRVEPLANALAEQGWSVWWDPIIPTGKDFDEVIEGELSKARCVIVIWTKRSVKSKYVKGEAREALNRSILVPIEIESGIKPPYDFRSIQTLSLTNWDGSDNFPKFQKLIADVINILDEPPTKVKLSEPKPAAKSTTEPESLEPRKTSNVLKFGVVAGVAVLLIVGIWWYISESQKTIANSIGMKFVLIPAGKFVMGSPPDEPGRDAGEKRHSVIIGKPFYLQITEVSQGQWEKVVGINPSHFKEYGDDCPVEQVSWDMAQEFISKLNQLEGTNKYRLPTEAEWEYACRAKTTTPFFTGDCISTDQANYNGNSPGENCPKGEYWKKPVKVGSFQPNAWGLYDMHGNVWEWCQDWYGDYSSVSVVDPKGPDEGESRVSRGGSWYGDARLLRSAHRRSIKPNDDSSSSVGFRVARDY